MQKHTASGELACKTLARRVVTGAIEEADGCVIAHAVAYSGLHRRSDEALHSVPLTSPSVIIEVLNAELDDERDWYLWDIPTTGLIDVGSSLQGDSSFVPKKCD